jgi:hypothetical protein
MPRETLVSFLILSGVEVFVNISELKIAQPRT